MTLSMAPGTQNFRVKSTAFGGWGGIRTHETLAGLPVFKTGAFNRSATHPSLLIRYAAEFAAIGLFSVSAATYSRANCCVEPTRLGTRTGRLRHPFNYHRPVGAPIGAEVKGRRICAKRCEV